MGAFGSIILAISYKAFTWEKLRESVHRTARTTAMVCFLFCGLMDIFVGIFLSRRGIINKRFYA